MNNGQTIFAHPNRLFASPNSYLKLSIEKMSNSSTNGHKSEHGDGQVEEYLRAI
jgi:hypothetical protein